METMTKTEERGFPRFFRAANAELWEETLLVRIDRDESVWTVILRDGSENVNGGSLVGLRAANFYVRRGDWIEVPRSEAEAMIAKARGESGAQRAADHAERTAPGWQDRAFELLAMFAKVKAQVGTPFLGESFRAYASTNGLEDPPDGRAFGAVFKRAAREGVIESVGFAPANSSNRSPKTLWRARA
jgi:hypothetical protein